MVQRRARHCKEEGGVCGRGVGTESQCGRGATRPGFPFQNSSRLAKTARQKRLVLKVVFSSVTFCFVYRAIKKTKDGKD